MAEPTRFTKLPGYDTAPDVYETPEVTNETPAAAPADTPTSGSSDSDETANSDEDGPFGGISRKRLIPDRARSRFQAVGSRVDTRGLDLSDRVDGRRRGLHVRQARYGEHDLEDETLEARIARLRKEVEECRALAQDRLSDGPTQTSEVDALGRMLAALESGEGTRPKEDQSSNDTSIQDGNQTEDAADEQTLSKITSFDGRLNALERALGLSSMDMDATGTFTTPLLPSLEVLDQQLSALMTSTSIAQLDASSSRIKKLAQEAEHLAQIQATPPTQSNGEVGDEEQETAIFSHDDIAKLNALYALLPTLQGLSPTVPALLERLKSLTALHSGAATAASELDDLVKKQADMTADLKSWEEALERLEGVVKHALEANGRNGNTVDTWVKDLQKRIEALQ